MFFVTRLTTPHKIHNGIFVGTKNSQMFKYLGLGPGAFVLHNIPNAAA